MAVEISKIDNQFASKNEQNILKWSNSLPKICTFLSRAQHHKTRKWFPWSDFIVWSFIRLFAMMAHWRLPVNIFRYCVPEQLHKVEKINIYICHFDIPDCQIDCKITKNILMTAFQTEQPFCWSHSSRWGMTDFAVKKAANQPPNKSKLNSWDK